MIAAYVGAATLAVVCGLGWRLRSRFVIVTVRGDSMRPTLRAGDRLLVRRVGLAVAPPGALVVLTVDGSPALRTGSGELMVKRLAAVPGDRVPADIPVSDVRVPADRMVVLGDNPAASADSRSVGYYPATALVGVAVRHI